MRKTKTTPKRKTRVIGVPLYPETAEFLQAQARAEQRSIASVARIHLQNVVAGLKKNSIIVEQSSNSSPNS